MLHMLTCSLSFLSVLLQGTQACFLPHALSCSTSLLLPPDPFALRWIPIASPVQCRQPVPLPLTDVLPLAEPIHKALIFIKVNLSLKKMWLMTKVFTLQITFNSPLVVSLVINANPSISSKPK